MRRRGGVAYIVASAVCFGTMAIMARFAYASGVDTTTLLAWPRGKTLAMLFAGLERVGPTRAAVLSTVEPVCTVLLAAALLGETIAPSQLVGGALILTTVVLLARAAPSE